MVSCAGEVLPLQLLPPLSFPGLTVQPSVRQPLLSGALPRSPPPPPAPHLPPEPGDGLSGVVVEPVGRVDEECRWTCDWLGTCPGLLLNHFDSGQVTELPSISRLRLGDKVGKATVLTSWAREDPA